MWPLICHATHFRCHTEFMNFHIPTLVWSLNVASCITIRVAGFFNALYSFWIQQIQNSVLMKHALSTLSVHYWRYGKTGASQSGRWHHYWTLVLDQPITSFMKSWSSEKCLQDAYPSDWHLKWKSDVSLLVKSFCVGMRLMVNHFYGVSSLGMRLGYSSTSQNNSDKAWSGSTPRPQNRKRCGDNYLQAKSRWLLGLQRADLRALHAQRKYCDQYHLLILSEGKAEARYSPETARVVDDGSVYPLWQCESTYCHSNSVDYWGAAVWVHPTPSLLTRPTALGFSHLWSVEEGAEWNGVRRRRWGSVGGAWVAAHPSERILFQLTLHACQALA